MYIATKSFSGHITMTAGERREISDPALVADLLKAGYIIEYKAEEKAEGEKENECQGKKAVRRKR